MDRIICDFFWPEHMETCNKLELEQPHITQRVSCLQERISDRKPSSLVKNNRNTAG